MPMWIVDAATLLAVAQLAQASVTGVVRDAETSEPLSEAVVTLADIDRTVVTDARGRYLFTAVPAGPQHVTVRRIGYAPRSVHALVPARGVLALDVGLRSVPVRLRPVSATPTVAIRGAEAREPSVERGMSIVAVRNHPLLGEPDVLLALDGGEIAMRLEAPSGVHLRGGASDQTGYALDGIPVFSPYHATGMFSAWNPDALDRIDVIDPSWTSDALSGTVIASTRVPGSRVRGQGSISTTQARATVDGPLGVGDGGYLVSVRSGFPGIVGPGSEPSYVRGESGDVLAKIETSGIGGRVRVLVYDNQNELTAAAVAGDPAGVPIDTRRNGFAWYSRSAGAEWSRVVGSTSVRLLAWEATSEASGIWLAASDAPVHLLSERADRGGLGVLEYRAARATRTLGVRVADSRMSYRVGQGTIDPPTFALDGRTPSVTVFVGEMRRVARTLNASLGVSATAARDERHIDPRVELKWTPAPTVTISATHATVHQRAQSLRNAESVVGSLFPADLHVGGAATGIPTARSDAGTIAAAYHPRDGAQISARLYARTFRDVVLVAPGTGGPFADRAVPTGSGTARGFSLDGTISAARYGLVVSYGWQRVRLEHGDVRYIPEYGAAHTLDVGGIVFLAPTTSLSFGAVGVAGRRATPTESPFEWEACNALDDGCELSGSPIHVTDGLGGIRLPPYLRFDIGLRKHWHVSVAGRDTQLGIFGTITNVLGRRNVLTLAGAESATGMTAIAMRPRVPLVVGMDWRF